MQLSNFNGGKKTQKLAMKRSTEKNQVTTEHKSLETIVPLEDSAVKNLVPENIINSSSKGLKTLDLN